ncbi:MULTISPECIES: YitT family protein [Nocardiaceae]|uniref:Membrane protein YczE n=1 Tax=Rhodococcoides corynebacterioides TaxID=53972 RepID=A0ABS2KXF5_9NOCA|nr:MULTISPECIES: membrane protein [Rhodococcus]MBM7416613.1 putative membrane protein YczE [Rhodococcus corynebacterioides]MBP1114866.1 putative membrane protein YczE [Rhodococcus sp. PvP016]
MNTRDLALRTALLVGGLTLYGTSMAMMITGGLGLNPWDVFHQGLAARLPISFGAITAVTGVMVLLLWIPLRQRPGTGTVANIVIIAVSVDLVSGWLPDVSSIPSRTAMLTGGVVLNGLATAAYISAGLGAGPRDGLMTGLVARTGLSVRLVRTVIELAVLGTGWLLGGTAGVGTVLYALAIGPLVHFFLGVMPQKFTAQKFTAPAAGDHSSVESSEPADRIPTETP